MIAHFGCDCWISSRIRCSDSRSFNSSLQHQVFWLETNWLFSNAYTYGRLRILGCVSFLLLRPRLLSSIPRMLLALIRPRCLPASVRSLLPVSIRLSLLASPPPRLPGTVLVMAVPHWCRLSCVTYFSKSLKPHSSATYFTIFNTAFSPT